jgi:hypothetical protein
MDMHAAYREVGSYRAAAEICGTTPKTVKRSVEAALKAESGPVPGEVRHNYDGVADVVAETVASGLRPPTMSGSLPPCSGVNRCPSTLTFPSPGPHLKLPPSATGQVHVASGQLCESSATRQSGCATVGN